MVATADRTQGYTSADLRELAGVGYAALRKYRKLGLLHPPAGGRRHATWDAEHLRRCKAIRNRRADESLADLRERFQAPRWWDRPSASQP